MRFIKRNSLAIGILLMYAFTWPPHLAAAGVIHVRFPLFIQRLPGWGFLYASVLMTALMSGTAGVGGLLRRFLIWRVSWRCTP